MKDKAGLDDSDEGDFNCSEQPSFYSEPIVLVSSRTSA
jgi:hypothetical protein